MKKKSGYKDVSVRIPQIPNPRRAQEDEDARILMSDHNAMSNLPTQPIHKEFNKYQQPHVFGEADEK